MGLITQIDDQLGLLFDFMQEKDLLDDTMVVSFPDPHHPFTPPGKYWDMYKPEEMPIPIAYEVNGELKSWYHGS